MTIGSNQFIADYKFRNMDIQHYLKKQINQLQIDLLQQHLQYIDQNSPFYQRVFRKNQIDISRIKNINDLKIIPPTSKEDLIHHNDEFLAAPEEDVIDVCLTRICVENLGCSRKIFKEEGFDSDKPSKYLMLLLSTNPPLIKG